MINTLISVLFINRLMSSLIDTASRRFSYLLACINICWSSKRFIDSFWRRFSNLLTYISCRPFDRFVTRWRLHWFFELWRFNYPIRVFFFFFSWDPNLRSWWPNCSTLRGWCLMIGSTTGLLSASLPAEWAQKIYGDHPNAITVQYNQWLGTK